MSPLRPPAPDVPDDFDITAVRERRTDAERLIDRLVDLGWNLAVAESLTGGLVVSSLVAVPGASAVVRGGVVTYATDLKGRVLGVDAGLLDAHGPVHPEVARQMAEGVRVALGEAGRRCDVGISTTGVAGPDSQDGHPVGTVHIGVSTRLGTRVETLALTGSRDAIRVEAARRAVRLALEAL